MRTVSRLIAAVLMGALVIAACGGTGARRQEDIRRCAQDAGRFTAALPQIPSAQYAYHWDGQRCLVKATIDLPSSAAPGYKIIRLYDVYGHRLINASSSLDALGTRKEIEEAMSR